MKTAFLKSHLTLISFFAGLTVLFIFSLNIISSAGVWFVQEKARAEIQEFFIQFRQQEKPFTEINFSELYNKGEQLQVLNPVLNFKNIMNSLSCEEKGIKSDESNFKNDVNKSSAKDESTSVLATLKDSDMESILKGEDLVISQDYVLFRNRIQWAFAPLVYSIYKKETFFEYLRKSKFDVNTQLSDVCLVKINKICWSFNSQQTFSYFYKYSFVIFLLIGIIFLSFIVFYLKNLYEKSKSQLKQKLSLQVLSHEFRTPVSALMLMIECLQKKPEGLSQNDYEDLVTRIGAEVFKLQRIVEVSKDYLQTEGESIQFNLIEIPSINQWVEDYLHEKENIKSECLAKDIAVKADPFWLKFILDNLIHNALLHGMSPVTLKLKETPKSINFSVEDQGICQFDSLQEMTGAFVKGTKSQGMGLGLNMILFITQQLKAKLTFHHQPTTFTLEVQK